MRPPKRSDVKYAFPFIILSEGDKGKRKELIPLATALLNGDHSILEELKQLMVPSGKNSYVVPFGNRRLPEEELDPTLKKFVNFLNEKCLWYIRNVKDGDSSSLKWVRLGGALFGYASKDLQQALSEEVLKPDFPKLNRFFWAYGQAIQDPSLLEQYLEKVLNSWGGRHEMHGWLFWPFFKSMCSYGETARIPERVALSVFKYANRMLGWLDREKGYSGNCNWKKWTLSAVLYGLRVRELKPDFLSLNDGPEEELKLAEEIREKLRRENIHRTVIPKLALRGLRIDGDPPTLPELILRFLEAKADDTDIKIAGGIGLTS